MQTTRFTWPKPRWTTWSLVRDERAGEAAAPPDSTQSCGASVEARTNARPDAVVRFDLIEGLAPEEVDRRIAHGRRAGDVGHRAVAYYLADCADRGLHQVLGHPGVVPYAVKRHAIPRRTARELVNAGRALRELRAIDQGFVDAKLPWSKVRAIVKVADPATEAEWITYALKHTIDEIEHKVSLARKGDRPREDGKGLHQTRFNLSLRVSAPLREQYQLARQKLAAEAGHEIKDEEFAGALLEAYLRRAPADQTSADSLYRVVMDMNPASPEGATIRSDDGPVPVDPATAAAIACDAGVRLTDGTTPEDQVPPISNGQRRRILARDGYRCQTCASRIQLHVHHIVWRSRCGSNANGNLVTLCSRCHGLVHDAFLVIEGTAPHALVFRNRDGAELTDPAPHVLGGQPELVVSAPRGPIGPPPASPTDVRPAVSYATLPGVVAASWIAAHRHLMSHDPERGVLRIKPGRPVDPTPEPAVDQAPEPAPAGAGGGAIAPPVFPRNSGDSLRPATLDDVIGQRAAVASLRLAAEAFRASGEMPDHVLLCGRPGLGKTTLARAFATEIGGRLVAVDSATVDSPFTLIGHLMNARDRDVVFLDEIHALPPKIAESLYRALEDGVLDLQFTDGLTTKAVQFELPRITFVGATTNPEHLPEPFLARFPTVEELDPYTPDDLCEIVLRAARRKGLDVAPDAAAILARASSKCARTAIALYRGMRKIVLAARRSSASADDARAALEGARIDARGLGPVHRRVLEVLARHRRPMASRRLARAAGVSVKAFRDLYEPALIELGAIVPTPRGMVIAPGWEPR